MKKPWNHFLKRMDHKFEHIDPIHFSGFQMDGADGIRNHCFIILEKSIQGIKACDYLYKTSNSFLCIEFSDLERMHNTYPLPHNLIVKWESDLMKEINEGKVAKPDYAKSILKTVSFNYKLEKEVIKKFKDSDLLLGKIKNQEASFFTDTQANLYGSKFPFFLIWKPPNEDNDIYRVLDSVKDEINSKIKDDKIMHLQKEINLTTLNDFFSL